MSLHRRQGCAVVDDGLPLPPVRSVPGANQSRVLTDIREGDRVVASLVDRRGRRDYTVATVRDEHEVDDLAPEYGVRQRPRLGASRGQFAVAGVRHVDGAGVARIGDQNRLDPAGVDLFQLWVAANRHVWPNLSRPSAWASAWASGEDAA